jgi:hypothetical protein
LYSSIFLPIYVSSSKIHLIKLTDPSDEQPLVENSLNSLIPSLFESDLQQDGEERKVHDEKFIFAKETIVTDQEFVQVIESVKQGIESGLDPVRIVKGSSGSYFCRNKEGTIVGVFKPKTEEPYGHLNPKWIKWMHRKLFPCCFGRECIIPNSGYLSEVAASYLDRKLGTHIVPRTEVVNLSSRAFNYSFNERWKHRIFRTPLPPKVGSFQIFLNEFQDSTTFFRDGYGRLTDPDAHPLSWNQNAINDFKNGFERLVILDYLIRNTDRGSDNWMIRSESETKDSPGETNIRVYIAAIDNGLAFPTSHPNRVRSYPYGWLSLPIVNSPFLKQTADQYLPRLTSSTWWESVLDGIEKIFELDKGFNARMWAEQKAVLRGQHYNLIDALAQSTVRPTSPYSLIERPLVKIHIEHDETDSDSGSIYIEGCTSQQSESNRSFIRAKKNFKKVKKRIETFSKNACFSRC